MTKNPHQQGRLRAAHLCIYCIERWPCRNAPISRAKSYLRSIRRRIRLGRLKKKYLREARLHKGEITWVN